MKELITGILSWLKLIGIFALLVVGLMAFGDHWHPLQCSFDVVMFLIICVAYSRSSNDHILAAIVIIQSLVILGYVQAHFFEYP